MVLVQQSTHGGTAFFVQNRLVFRQVIFAPQLPGPGAAHVALILTLEETLFVF